MIRPSWTKARKLLACRACFLGLACTLATAQMRAQTIRIDKSVLVAASAPDQQLEEPHLALDPANPDHLVAVAMVGGASVGTFDEQQDRRHCASFLSRDGGATWARHDFATTRCADPWVVITPDGHALVTMLGAHPSLPQQGRGGLLAFRSTDGGGTWDDTPIGLGGNHDHTTMAMDLSAGPRRGWIYLSSHRPLRADDGLLRYGVYMVRSRNGGRTFDDPVYVVVNNLHNLPEMPAVLADGTLFQSFVDCCHSNDTGTTASVSATQKTVIFQQRRAWVIRSTDGGYSFSTPLFVTDACGPPPGYRLSAFAADGSAGPFTGRLYFACREKGGGPIVINHSRDRGETWTSSTAVHSAAPESVVEGRIPALAVSVRGAVAVAWIDATGKARQPCQESVYVAASLDGGHSFSAGQLVSRTAGCGTGGDYFGLVAMPDGRFRLLWAEPRDGVTQLRTTTLAVEGKIVDGK
jgi:hypothetical protein